MHEDALSRFIYNIVRDSHDAKHLVVDAFAQLATGGKKFAGESTVKTYLFTIGRNLALKHIRTRGAEEHISYEELIGMIKDESGTPDRFFERAENRKQLHDIMKSLNEDYFAVLWLLYFEDMSYRQAGKVMSKTDTQIKHLAYRAKAALKKKLNNEGFSQD